MYELLGENLTSSGKFIITEAKKRLLVVKSCDLSVKVTSMGSFMIVESKK